MKRSLIVSATALLLLTALILYARHPPDDRLSVCFSDSCVKAEKADSDIERALGLMNRKFLPADEGMLFIFDDEGIHPFWMKNTLISLDMIWLDSQLRVVHIEHAVPCTGDPCPNYTPTANAKYVLEVNAGYAGKHDIAVGSTAAIK